MDQWSFPDSTILLLCELEGAITERLSPSLKRAAKDILGWFMAFVKVIIAKDPELIHRMAYARLRDLHKPARERRPVPNYELAEIYESEMLNIIPGGKTDFSFHRTEGAEEFEDRFLLSFRNVPVPAYWRLATNKALDGHISFKVIRGGKRDTVFASGAFGQGEKFYVFELDSGVRTSGDLDIGCLPALKSEAVGTIYHELQHFYQTTPGAAIAHKFEPEELERYNRAIEGGGDPRDYYLSPKEVDAVSTELYRTARNQRQPLEDLIAARVARASSGSLLAGRTDREFSRDYVQALIASLEKKYPATRGTLKARRVLEKELKYWHGVA